MANVCKIILIGNLTREPELKYAASGTAVCSFGMAMNHKYGEREEVCFLDVTAFGKLGELASEYLAKGRQAYVEGRLRHNTWESQDGQKHSKHVVIAETIQFLGARDAAPAKPRGPSALPTVAAPTPAHREPDVEEDDIPFIRCDIDDGLSLLERGKFLA